MVVWIVLGVVVLVLLIGIVLFNRLVSLRNRVDNGWSQIDVQLRRRYDLIGFDPRGIVQPHPAISGCKAMRGCSNPRRAGEPPRRSRRT